MKGYKSKQMRKELLERAKYVSEYVRKDCKCDIEEYVNIRTYENHRAHADKMDFIGFVAMFCIMLAFPFAMILAWYGFYAQF